MPLLGIFQRLVSLLQQLELLYGIRGFVMIRVVLSSCFRASLPFAKKLFRSYFQVKLGLSYRIQQQERLVAAEVEKQKWFIDVNLGIILQCARNIVVNIINQKQIEKLEAPQTPLETCQNLQNQALMRQNIVYLLSYNLKAVMKDEKEAQKLKIHQILNRHSFYRLPLVKLLQILRLIEMPEARQAKGIQENAFAGIMKITQQMKLPPNYSRMMAKLYFNPQVEKDISPQVRSYVTKIIEDYLEKIKDKETQKVIVDTRKDANLYPMMAYNTLTYPNPIDYTSSPKESSNMHLQMYYMNIYNYGNHPQVSLNQPYSTFPKDSTQKQPQEKGYHQQMKNKGQKDITEKQIDAKQVEMRQMQVQVDPHLDIKGEKYVEQNVKMQDQQVKLIQSEMSPQFQMNKRPYIDIGFDSPIINPLSQFLNQTDIKLVSNEVQIQTDLSLLNEEIQVFPRQKPQTQQKQYFFIQKARVMDQGRLAKRKRKQKQRLRQKQKQKQQPQEKIVPNDDLPQSPDMPPEKKETKQYIITVRKEYLDQDQPKEQNQAQELPPLQKKSSQFEKLQRKMSLELCVLKKGVNLKESLRNCPCKGNKEQLDIFQCLTCKRMFHNSCLKSQGLFDVQQCHICKLQMYETTTEFKECNGIFYTSEALREDINVELAIAQYEYFLFRKIRHHEIELRCCRLNDVENVEMVWPEIMTISVNGTVALQYPMTYIRKRKDAIFITQHLIQGNYEKIDEKIKISFDFPPANKDSTVTNSKTLYVIGIYFVEKIKFEVFIEKYSRNLACFDSEYITRLMEINNIDSDDGLEIEKLICNLWDPFSRTLIKTPVRGSICLHLQCFDLKNYLTFMYATKNRLWKCPICNKDSKKLLLDRQFKELIRKSVQSKTIPSQITFMKDGRILLKISSNQESDQQTPPFVQQAKRKWINNPNKIDKNTNPKKKQEYNYRA